MIRLGKLANGVALFNFDEMIKIIFQKEVDGSILVCFDTSIYDRYNPDDIWFVKDFDILKKGNEQIFEYLDQLYAAGVARVKVYPVRYSYVDQNHEIKSFLQPVGNNYELKYPSDGYLPSQATWFGIIKYQNQAYSLTFHKSTDKNKQNLRSVRIKYTDEIDSELYPKYNKFMQALESIAFEDFEKVNKEFNTYVNSEELSAKQIRLTRYND